MRYLRSLLILLLVALAVFQLRPHFAEFKNFTNSLLNVNYLWLALSAALIVGQYLGDGWLSQILLKITGHKIDLKTALKIASIDVFAAHILPIGEAGVVATSAYFYKKIGVSNQGVLFLTAAWAATTSIVAAVILLTSLIFLPKLPGASIHILDITKVVIFFVLITFLVIFTLRRAAFRFINDKFKNIVLFIEIKKFISELSVHKQNIARNKKMAVKAMIAALIYYVANIASLYFCFVAFGLSPNVSVVTFAYLLSLIVSYVTLAPAGIGAQEATMVLIFLQYGVNPIITTAAVLAFRILVFWLPIPAGIFSYLSLKGRD